MIEINKIYLMDCMDLMKQMPDNFIDLAICDPPYGIERFKRGSIRFAKDSKYKNGITWDKKPDNNYFNELFRISKNQIIWGANNFQLPPSEYFIIWNKMQTVDNFATCEYAWTNCKIPAKMYNYSIHKHNQIKKIHPTQKPVTLYKWLLEFYAKKGDLIFDSHLGSMSSIIACIQYEFDYIGCEIDKEYYEQGKKRIRIEKMQLKIEYC